MLSIVARVVHPHETLVRNAYRAFNDGDIDRFLEAFDENAVLHGGDGQLEGKAAIRGVVQQLRDQGMYSIASVLGHHVLRCICAHRKSSAVS